MKVIKKGMKPPVQSTASAPPSPPVEIKQPEATVTVNYPDGTQTEDKIPVGEPGPVPVPHANVGVSMGMTIKTGDFENIKFSVSLFCPTEVDVDSINGTYEEVKAWVDSKTDEIHTEIRTQIG